jgi:hypothetical protein
VGRQQVLEVAGMPEQRAGSARRAARQQEMAGRCGKGRVCVASSHLGMKGLENKENDFFTFFTVFVLPLRLSPCKNTYG